MANNAGFKIFLSSVFLQTLFIKTCMLSVFRTPQLDADFAIRKAGSLSSLVAGNTPRLAASYFGQAYT